MDELPDALLQAILSRLDIPSLCSAASSSRLLSTAASQALSRLSSFHLLDLAPRNEDLMRLLKHNQEVKSLKIDCEHLDDRALSVITKPHLEELQLQNCVLFSSKFLTEIGCHCRTLRSLSVELGWRDNRNTSVHSPGFEELLQQCSNLETLSLKDQDCNLDSHAYAAIPQLVSSKLKVLELGYVLETNAKQLFTFPLLRNNIEETGPKHFRLRNLQKLSLDLDRLTDSLMLLISQNMPHLLDLELQDQPSEEPLLAFDLTTTGIQHLGALSNLQRLALVRNQDYYASTFKRVEDLGFLLLAERCRKLEMIRMGGFSRISDATCRQILHSFPKLHTFELLKSPRVTDLTFRDFSAVPISLVSITLASCSLISDFAIEQLSYCKNLEILNLKGCKCVGDKGLAAITGLSKLKTLNLSGLDISDEGLIKLGKGQTPLVSLSLRGCQRVSDAGVAGLVGGSISRTLECIDLSNVLSLTDRAVLELIQSGVQIVDLRLRDCIGIGDSSVIALASMTFKGCGFGGTLRLLDLWNCKGLTLLSFGWFKKPYFPRLRWLGLGWNSVSKSVLDSLSQGRPYLRILDHGHELDGYATAGAYDYHPPFYEEEDELERWLRVG